MSTLTLAEICDAIAGALGQASGLEATQSYDELTEGMNTLPALQVYPEEGEGAPRQHTFGGAVKVSDLTFTADLYARQRSEMGEDMAALLPLADRTIALLQQQEPNAPFGLSGVRDLTYSWRRVIFEYGTVGYIGVRFTLRVRVY